MAHWENSKCELKYASLEANMGHMPRLSMREFESCNHEVRKSRWEVLFCSWLIVSTLCFPVHNLLPYLWTWLLWLWTRFSRRHHIEFQQLDSERETWKEFKPLNLKKPLLQCCLPGEDASVQQALPWFYIKFSYSSNAHHADYCFSQDKPDQGALCLHHC